MSTLKSDKGLIAPLPSRAAQPVWRSRLVSRLISCSLFVGALCLVALQATDYGTISPSFWQDTRIIPHAPSHDPFHFSNCPGTDTKFKCGYLDVPLDWTNSSDPRTARLAVTLYQAGAQKSPRTIVVNPGKEDDMRAARDLFLES